MAIRGGLLPGCRLLASAVFLAVATLLLAAAAVKAQESWMKNTVVENAGDLRLGMSQHLTFGVHESETRQFSCTETDCVYGPANRPADHPSRHGVDVTGLRFRPRDSTQNIDMLAEDHSGGWGLYARETASGQVSHACVVDKSPDCMGRPDLVEDYGNGLWFGGQRTDRSQPGSTYYTSHSNAGGARIGNPTYGISFHPYISMVDTAPLFYGDRATTAFPGAIRFSEGFAYGLDDLGDEMLYRRSFLPSIPTDGSVPGTPLWDGATRISFGMRDSVPPPALRFSSTNGHVVPDPTQPYDSTWADEGPACPVTVGPGSVSGGTVFSKAARCDEGMMVELDLMALPRDTTPNRLPSGVGMFGTAVGARVYADLSHYLAVAETPADVQPLLDALDADIWFTAEGPDPAGEKEPLTFIWAIPDLYPTLPPLVDIGFTVDPPAEPPEGWTLQTPCVGQPVTFMDDGTTQAYPALLKSNQWTVDGVAQPVNHPRADLTWTFTTAGTHTLRLAETNDLGLVGTKDMTVTVLDCTPPPLPPTATLDPPSVTIDDCAPASFRFTGIGDAVKGRPDQDFVKWSLAFGDGESTGLVDWPPPAFILHDYLQPGTFVATVLVKDSKGMTDTEMQYVSVCANRAPTVAGPTKVLTAAGKAVPLSLDLADRDWGAKVTLRLIGIPGTPGLGPLTMPHRGVLTVTGLLPGSYAVTAEATDETGATGQWHFPIFVSKPPNPAPDHDGDGVSDSADLCAGDGASTVDGCSAAAAPLPVAVALGPSDLDQDGIGDGADNCPMIPNAMQADLDQDLLGDECDQDGDGDGVPEGTPGGGDNCPGHANPDQLDQDNDGTGDACHPPVFPRQATATPASWPHARGRGAWPPGTATAFAAAFAAVLAGLAWLNRHRLVWLATFSRLARDKLLENPLRSQLHALVTENPGIHLAGLMKRTGKARNVVQHHLRQLVAQRMVREHNADGFVCYWPQDAPHAKATQLSPRARCIMAQVEQTPGLSIRELARRLEVSPATVLRHVGPMVVAGFIRTEPDGQRVQVFPAAGLRQAEPDHGPAHSVA